MPSSGCSTATKATSLISCTTSWLGCPVTADLNLRGRFASDASPMNREVISSICGVGSISSSAAMPATGEPSTTRGTSPHASVVPSPTASRRRQISGIDSTSIQCSWMFWRSVRSAVSRPNSVEMPAMTRSCSVVSCPPSMRTRSMKYSSSSSCGSSVAVRPPSMPGLRCVYSPHTRNRPCRSVGSIEANPPFE